MSDSLNSRPKRQSRSDRCIDAATRCRSHSVQVREERQADGHRIHRSSGVVERVELRFAEFNRVRLLSLGGFVPARWPAAAEARPRFLANVECHHRAGCSDSGVLGRRGFALESAAARICREAGARVSTNIFVRDLDLASFGGVDGRRLEVVAEGLPVFSPGSAGHRHYSGLFFALMECHTASVPPLMVLPCMQPSAARRGYPELSGNQGRARLVFLAAEVGGRWYQSRCPR